MGGANPPERKRILPEMKILEVVDRYSETEGVFKKYDSLAGVCLCCSALFESLQDTAEKYGLNLEMLMDELEATAGGVKEKQHSPETTAETPKETAAVNPEK